MMAQQQCVLEVRPLVIEIAPHRRGAVSQEQRHAIAEPLLHRGAQQIVKSRLFPKSPREQQFKPAVVAQEVHIVKRLLVVWIGTRIEQKLDERARLRVWRAATGPASPMPIAPVMAVYRTWYMRVCVLGSAPRSSKRRAHASGSQNSRAARRALQT